MVSVIIPSYNSEKYIAQSLKSALVQSVDREILIIDDKSRDDTINVIRDFLADNYVIRKHEYSAKRFSDLVVLFSVKIIATKNDDAKFVPCNLYILINSKNRGVAYSRNKGVRVAKGEYVAFLDADDWWKKNKLEKQLELMESTGSFLCTTDRELILSGDEPSGAVVKSPAYITFRKLLRSNWINCSAVVARREAILKFPMKPGKLHEDYLCWLNIVKVYGPAVNISEPLLKYRFTLKSKSGNKFKSLKMSYNTYKEFGYGRTRAFVLTLRNMQFGLGKFIKSFITKTFSGKIK